MQKFLPQYRASPHSTTSICPHKLLFNIDPDTKLPTILVNKSNTLSNPYIEKLLHRDDDLKNFQIKLQEDQRIEQPVQQRNKKETMGSDEERGKFTLTYDAKPYKIVSKKGSIITARRGEKERRYIIWCI